MRTNIQNVYKMYFVLQIINFHSHKTSPKNKNNKEYLEFVLAGFHTCLFYNAVVSKGHFYLGTSIILFTEDTKMWMIHLYIVEIFVILQLKKLQGDVLQLDIELCPFCCFPVTIHIAG